MAFDAGMLSAVLSEICGKSIGAKVDKVTQPTADEVDLLLKNNGETSRLIINAGSAVPRIAFSDIARESPAVAPPFCMLLRKHLLGARLTDVLQPDFERVAVLVFAAYDEMGYPCEKKLVAELMGKYSNLILLSEHGKILSALRIVDFTVSRVRQILPGMTYELPPKQAEKSSPLTETEAGFLEKYRSASDMLAEKFLTSVYSGTAVQVAREIVYRACGHTDARLSEVDETEFFSAFTEVRKYLLDRVYTPSVYVDDVGMPKEYFYFRPMYLSEAGIRVFDNFSSLFDYYFGERDRMERIRERGADLLRMLNNAKTRVSRRLEAQRGELAEAAGAERYRKEGDLITANIYRLKKGAEFLTATDYESEEPTEVVIALDARLSPSQNAQKAYRRYNKLKTASRILTEQIEAGEAEVTYLDSVESFLEAAETEEDLSEIREELYTAGYASRMKNYTPPKNRKMHPITGETTNGYRLYAGRNNIQNDYLTFRFAGKNDLWFHVKNLPGSHVILVCNGEEPPAEDYTDAAKFAVLHSKAPKGATVTVDYTRVRNVKKPPAAKPGFVIYHTNYSAYIKAESAFGEKKEND